MTGTGEIDGDWAVVAIVDAMTAEILKVALDTAGIPTVVRQEASGRIIGITVGTLGEASLLVPSDRLAEASALIDDSQPIDFPESD